MAIVEVKVPDIGDFDEVAVIEVLVKVGDTVKPEQSLITVESDKASMEIPSTAGGVVKELRVKVGDKVREGSVVLLLEAGAAAGDKDTASPAQGTTHSPAPGQQGRDNNPPPLGEGRVGARAAEPMPPPQPSP